MDFNTNDATAGSTSADMDVTVTEDMEVLSAMGEETIDNNDTLTSERLNALFNNSAPNSIENNLSQPSAGITPKIISPLDSNISIFTNVLNSPPEASNVKHMENEERVQPSTSRAVNEFNKNEFKNILKQSLVYEKNVPNFNVNLSNFGSDKWSTSKEKFLEGKGQNKTDNIDFGKNLFTNVEKKVEKENELIKINPGAVVIKETYIEPPKISRVSKSFHGKTHTSSSGLNVSTNSRRASDGPVPERNPSLQDVQRANSEKNKSSKRPQFFTQKSQPLGTSSYSPNVLTRKTSLTESVSTQITSINI